MLPAHRRSQRGQVETTRAGVLAVPLLSALVLMMAGRRFEGAYINPQSLGELRPWVAPLFVGSLLVTAFFRITLRPTTMAMLRVWGMVLTYAVAGAAAMAGLLYFLAGASPAWAIFGYVLILIAINAVSLGRLGEGLTTRP